MQFRFISLLLAAGFVFTLVAGADTVVLKSGEKIDGKIVKETDADYTVEYKVSASITDTRTVLKSEVDKIDKVAPDELAYQAIKNVKPGPFSLATEGYEATMRMLQGFLDQYPKSPLAAEIVPVLTAFAEEKNRAEAGEIKIDGKWISQADAQKERYQIMARSFFGGMQETARRGDLAGALNLFAQFEKSYPGANVFPDAVATAQQILTRLKATAEQQLQSWKVQLKERDAATQLLSEPQRGQTVAAQKREQQQFDLNLEAATKGGFHWPALQKHERTLTTVIAKAQTEIARLDKLPVAKMRESIKLAEQARTKLEAKDEDGARDDLKQAKALWSTNELATRLDKDLATARQAAAKATPVPPAATPEVAVKAATPRPTPPPVVATPPPPPKEEPKSFFATPRGLAAIAVAVLGIGFLIYQKKKKAADQQFE